MKAVEEVTACVIDFGSFISVADKLGERMAQVYYHSPFEIEFQNVRDVIKGCGLDHATRLDDPLDPDVLNSIDLFVFPDIGFSGLQKHLRALGKAVWGHMGATELELYRTKFLEVIESVGLPIVDSIPIKGLTALADYLKEHDRKWIKIDRFRGNMETWHHIDYAHSIRRLETLAVSFGGYREEVMFIVQDELESDMEVGYDGWSVDGEFPNASFQGYEKKNELYLGAVLAANDLPKEIQTVNEAMSPILQGYGYRCWWATEIRIADGVPYFIDPTARMPGQTGEHQLETCDNLAEVIWYGTQGIVVQPKFNALYALEATLHYDGEPHDPEIKDAAWKILDLPEEARRWIKLYYYSKIDGLYHFLPHHTDEVGIIMGRGDTIEDGLTHLVENLELIKHLPLHAEVDGFTDLLKEVEAATEQGVRFGSGGVPSPEIVLEIADG